MLLARALPSAAARYAILAVAFLAAAGEPFAAVVLSAGHAPHANLALPLERALAVRGPLDVIFAIVGAITIVLLGDVAFALYRLLLVKRGARVDRSFARGARRAPVAYSEDVESATAIGYRSPCVVLPSGIESLVDPSELRAIIAHENAHLARYDDWAKALQAIVVRLLWFAPALWILARRLDLERELASDERVAATLDPRAYAACLLRLAVDVPGRHVAPAAWRGRAQIAIRVEELLRPARRLGGGGVAVRIAALTAAIVTGAFGAGALVPADAPVAGAIAGGLPPRSGARPPHALSLRALRAPRPRTVAVVRDTPAGPVAAPLPVVAAPLRSGALLVPGLPSVVPRRAEEHRLPAVIAAAPSVPAGPSATAGAPCRTCVMLRRPVTDGPAVALPRPLPEPSEQPVADPPDPAFSGVRSRSWDPNSLAPSWPGLLY